MGFIGGMMIGTAAGVLLMAMLFMSKDFGADERGED